MYIWFSKKITSHNKDDQLQSCKSRKGCSMEGIESRNGTILLIWDEWKRKGDNPNVI